MDSSTLREDISKIIYDGVLAPSGENSQPWRFVVDGTTIYILNIKKRDSTLYNSGQHGSYVAHGALTENMVISASRFGYKADVSYFPSGTLNPVVKIILTKDSIHQDHLYEVISRRCTNRNPYLPRKIPDEDKKTIIEESEKRGVGTYKIIDDPEMMNILATASATVERLMFESKIFHRFFFEHFFTRQRDENVPSGFYIDTLGMTSFEKFGIKLTKSWFIASIFRITGIADIVIAKRALHYRKSGAFGVVIAYGDEPIDYIQAGRTMERVWLSSTKLGISLQPCVGILYLWEGVMKNADFIFTDKEKGIIEKARNQILEVFDVQGKTVPMFFRMGYGETPLVRAFRYEPEIDYLS